MAVPSTDGRLELEPGLRAKLLAIAPTSPPSPETAAEYLGDLPNVRFASWRLKTGSAAPLIQPRGGFSRFDDQRCLTKALAEGGADFLPLTIDSHTRHNDYETAGVLLERSKLEDANLLNGYPLVNHGYRVSRRLFDGIDRPISLRHGTPDARLLVEVALATGITEIEGGGLSYTIPYTRAYPVMQALLHWQYVDRLCAMISEGGHPIHRESFGVLTATLVPPVMVVVVELCELLLAAEQGVVSFAVSFAQTGSVTQDLALAQVLRAAARDYLERFGFDDVSVYLVFHQWMGAFPYEYDKANALIATAAMNAAMMKADKIVTKTREEARGVPTVESNCDAVRLVRYVLEKVPMSMAITNSMVEREVVRIRAEVDAVMEAIFAVRSETFWHSIYRAFEQGLIDVPFAPHEANKNCLVTRRGRDHGIYIVDQGNLPLPEEAKKEEALGLDSRESAPGGETFFRAVMKDINLMLE